MNEISKEAQRLDGFANVLNRYGTSNDPSEQYRFEPEPAVSDEFLSMFYEENGLFARIIDTPAEEAVRRGFELDGISDRKIKDFCQEEYDYLDGDGVFSTAIRWARIFGGALAVMLIDDGGGLEDPLVWEHIRSIDEIRLYDRSLIQPDYNSVFSYDGKDPFEARKDRFGMPEYYSVFSKYGTFRVHESRCLIFRNGQLPEKATNIAYQFWGMPEYVRIRKAVQNAELAHASAPKLLDRAVQAVFKMKNLADALSTEEGEKNVLDRLQSIDTTRGLLNAIAIDMEGEDYEFKQIELSGAGDIIKQSISYLSAVTSIPRKILIGTTITEKKNTDDTSMEIYYNFVERIQSTMMKSNLRYLLAIIFQAGLYQGKISEIPPLDIKFRSLWSMTALEEAQNDLKRAQTQQKKAEAAKTYVDMGAITPEEVRRKLADIYTFDAENILKKRKRGQK